MPTFSVIIPAYNRSDIIRPTLESVQSQDFTDFECLVIDDGSRDAEALERVVNGLGDPRFRYVWRPNGGGGAARNTGIDAAVGDYIAFLDSDDLFLPGKLSTAAAHLDRNAVKQVLYTQTLVERGKNDRKWTRPERSIGPDERVATYLFIANQIIQTSTIVMNAGFAKAVRFDDNLRKGQDLDFCLRIEAAGGTFKMLDRPGSIWVDKSEAGRTSRTKGFEQPQRWLDQHIALMREDEIAGYRATSLAYYWAWQKPGSAIMAFYRGWRAGVSSRIIIRQMARTFLPRGFYRWAVDTFVANFGKTG
jgi:glycosyltransferase involved in cell wall biosynthesis